MATGRRLRIVNIVDDVTRECLRAVLDTSISGKRGVRELTDLIIERGAARMIVSDIGTELTSNAVLAWSGETRVEWHCIAPGKPTQNGVRRELQRSHAIQAAQRDVVLYCPPGALDSCAMG
jgi:putative transposase